MEKDKIDLLFARGGLYDDLDKLFIKHRKRGLTYEDIYFHMFTHLFEYMNKLIIKDR